MKISKSKLTRELLENYVEKDVRITFFDGDVREGETFRGFVATLNAVIDESCHRKRQYRRAEQ